MLLSMFIYKTRSGWGALIFMILVVIDLRLSKWRIDESKEANNEFTQQLEMWREKLPENFLVYNIANAIPYWKFMSLQSTVGLIAINIIGAGCINQSPLQYNQFKMLGVPQLIILKKCLKS